MDFETVMNDGLAVDLKRGHSDWWTLIGCSLLPPPRKRKASPATLDERGVEAATNRVTELFAHPTNGWHWRCLSPAPTSERAAKTRIRRSRLRVISPAPPARRTQIESPRQMCMNHKSQPNRSTTPAPFHSYKRHYACLGSSLQDRRKVLIRNIRPILTHHPSIHS